MKDKKKRILGLDLGTTSIGWALVEEDQEKESKIVKLGVRVNPLSTDEQNDFEKGNPITTNADRTLKRGARRNLQRFKLRREKLIQILLDNRFISEKTPLTEIGKDTTHQTLCFRAKSAREKVTLEDLAKILLTINRKRGYKSNRKTKASEDEGTAVDAMEIAKILHDKNLTPGQYLYPFLEKGKKDIPDFYRSDLQNEFDKIWRFQKQFYPEILTDDFYKKLQNKGQQQSRKLFLAVHEIFTAENKGNKDTVNLLHYQWRNEAISTQLPEEELAYVLVEINNQLNKSSGYLGEISNRSKILYLNKQTIGEYLYSQIKANPHTRLKSQVFYRQDYKDEFEQIWKTQATFYPQLTDQLKKKIGEEIFYQRKLKSQKGLLSFCEFESRQQKYIDSSGKEKIATAGPRVLSKASPLFQEFKIWQQLNNLSFKNKQTKEIIEFATLDEQIKKTVFDALNRRGNLPVKEIIVLLKKYITIKNSTDWKANFKAIEGNSTHKALYEVYQKIAQNEGYGHLWEKKNLSEIKAELTAVFKQIGINPKILDFEATLKGEDFYQQPSYQLWHLLYSAEDDVKISLKDRATYGNNDVSLKKKLHLKYGFPPKYATLLTNISLSEDYGNLSAKAIRKIIPFLQQGAIYSDACKAAGYNHSHSLDKEELTKQQLKPKLELLKKNSLRNPVVEKILNQMVNVINQVIDQYGKPKGIRIEMARDLKNSAKTRKDIEKSIRDNTKINDKIKAIIKEKFGFTATKNDVVKYKLWKELEANGYKSLYTNKCIREEDLFSKKIQIEHIIPKALYYNDSLSNKTLAYHEVNLRKADRTASDFISQDYQADLENYKARVASLYDKGKGKINKKKYENLLLSAKDLGEENKFTNRDLTNTRYISKAAKKMLQEVFGFGSKDVIVINSGEITSKLRKDWDLINVMKELNFSKYKSLGLTETEIRKGGKKVEVIKDWTKRNDHRHHAMDALTVAFATHNHIQYLNYKHARDKSQDPKSIYGIRNLITEKDENGKEKFIAPMPNFREEAKKQIEAILISFKSKNKVVTRNKNKTKLQGSKKENCTIQLTPRGELHKETIYGKAKHILAEPQKINKISSLEKAHLIANKEQKGLVLNHLQQFDNDFKLAFSSKILKKQPILFGGKPLTEVRCFEEIYTIRKAVNATNFGTLKQLDKIIDGGIKEMLKNRLAKFDNNPKKAFSNLDKDPIWLNEEEEKEEKKIAIKRVTIKGVNNTEPLHYKKDHFGNAILDETGEKQEVDFISTGNNHHVAIYKDKKDVLYEKIVSFYEAVIRANSGLAIIDRNYNEAIGWEFQFTMKQNEFFVFPSDDFNPLEIDLCDEKNATLISKHLFRIQKLSSKYYVFRHHLETTVEDVKVLRGDKWKRIQKVSGVKDIIKVRINHIGKIVHIGE